ncbi:DUF4886 domain-containing protein [Mameliella sp.]|uniref:DUF4886 domain-containing protein n=1 Tax=Mameliella sp. TaxID=1924940 RepID=UPI003BA9285C
MKFKTILAAAACIAALPAIAQDAPEIDSLDMEAPKRLLFVGNSYLYYGDSLHNHVVRMARAAYPDDSFTYKSATISGAYLDHHDIDSHLVPGKLGVDEPFDVVILQGHSTAMTTDEKVKRFNDAAKEMQAAIAATGAKTALYMTPAYSDEHRRYDPGMFDKVDAGYTAAGNTLDALVIPVGLAFEMAYERQPDINLHKDFDGSHPTLLGTYLAAATTYAALYGESVVGNPYDYFGSVSEEDAAFLQLVAEDAVAAYYSR